MVGFEEDSKASAMGVSVGNQLVAVNGESVVGSLYMFLKVVIRPAISEDLCVYQVGAPIVDAVGLIGAARASAGDTAPIDLVFFRCHIHSPKPIMSSMFRL